MKNWGEIASYSELLAAQEIKQSFDAGDLTDVEEGLTQLIDTLSRSERRALQSQLIRLMMHIIKWQVQPEKRSRSWSTTIRNARFEIKALQKYTPSLNADFVKGIWQESLTEAGEEAESETGITAATAVELTWEAVFETTYTL
ncbi:MAG: DUF29 domain-containing protein [Bacteroidetes bacterium]|nr:DUF29 domain-containing protein [Fibrella sp.]